MKRLKETISKGRVFNTLLIIILGSSLIWSCSSSDASSQNNSSLDTDINHFPDRVKIDHAIGFDIIYHKFWKELILFRHYNDLIDTVKFALVLEGAPLPEGFQDIRTIQIPVENLATVSTTHLGMFEMLKALDNLKGIEAAKYVSSEVVRQRVEEDLIHELAPSGMLNTELVLAHEIDVLMGVGFPNSQNESYRSLENAGVPVLLNADWQERTLLGRAEWVKMLAALLNREKEVNASFIKIEEEYNAVLAKLDQVKEAPLTITGLAEGDAWFVAGGKSFAHELLKLANVDYPWSDNKETGSLRLDFETVYEFGLKADFWMVPSTAKSLIEILAADKRYSDFKSFKEQNIYNIYGRHTPGGGNDFYESAVVNPDVVLKDIIKIFHPDLLPEHELVYYNRLQ